MQESETSKLLFDILELLKINSAEYQNEIVRGQIIRTGISLAVLLILTFVFVYIVRKYNEEFCIKDNVLNILNVMKDYSGRKDMNTNVEYTDTLSNAFNEVIDEIKHFLHGHFFWRIAITIMSVWIEISWTIKLIFTITDKIIMLVNCFYAPSKVFVDYISTLF